MNEFYNFFNTYISESDAAQIGFAEITRLVVKRDTRYALIELRSDRLVGADVIERVQKGIADGLQLHKAEVKVKYPKNLFSVDEIEKIISPIRFTNQMVNGFFDACEAEIEDNTLTVFLKNGGQELLESQGVDKEISKLIYDAFDIDLDVSFMQVQTFDVEKAVHEAFEQKKEKERAVREEQEKNAVHTILGDTPLYADTRKVVMGRNIRELPKPIKDVKYDDGVITVWGDILKSECRDTRRGDSKILTFDISDYTSSITVKVFDRNNVVEPLLKVVEGGGTLIINGSYQFDKFSNESVLRPTSIEKVQKAEKMDTAEEKRVELHLHTTMSDMDGMTAPKELVKRAAKWGHKAIAVTDHGVVQALPEAYAAAKANGIKLILGMEGYLVDDSLYPDFMNMKLKEFRRHHIILLVKEDNSLDDSVPKEERKYGRKNLYEMISHSNVRTFKGRPLIPKSMLAKKRDGIIVGSACEQGEIIQAILRGESDEELLRLAAFYDYLEIQPNGNNAFMIRSERDIHQHINSEEDLININKKVVELADTLGKMTVATGDVHFIDPKDAKFRAILMASKGFDDADQQAPLYFKTTDEMLSDFAWAGDRAKEFVIDNPNKIADMVWDDIPPIPPGTFQPHIDGADEELTKKCWDMAKDLYGDPVPEYVAARLERELNSIISHGFGVLYVIAKRLVEESERNGYLVGSRGSVGSSLAAHFGGISEVNPLAPHYYCKNCKHSEFFLNGEYGSGFDLPPKNCPECGAPMKRDGHEIPFETFLGFDGDKEPDIDLNFSGEYQSRSHRFTEELFGKEYVFKAGTMATVADKTAYGYVVKYLEERDLLAVTPKAEIDRLTVGCTGIKRTTGQHPGGMVVVPDEYTVEDFTPIQYPSNDEKKGTYTTHFDFKNSLHDTLLKLDELGHDNPTLYKYLEDATGIPVMDVDLSDPNLYKLITSTEPIGVNPDDIDCPTGTLAIPEMGTPFVIGMLTEAQPKTFADLLQISGLSHGTDVWLGNAQELIQNGTCGISDVIGCRDDIMTHLIHVAEKYERDTGEESPLSKKDCFKIMEYTRKGKAPKELPPYEDAMKKIGVEQWYIDSCYKIKYMFPKAHAAAYVIAALRIAWYKIYYPIQFYSAYFTVRGGAIDAVAAVQGKAAVKAKMEEYKNKKNHGIEVSQKEEDTYVVNQIVIEMLARGYEFLPVDLYKSDWRVYQIEEGMIRLPFSAIDGIGDKAAIAIADAVKRNPEGFIASDDLANEPGVGKSVVDALRAAGALGDLPESKQISLFGF
ncbi:MAG: PolC-type DNA polymerase III [Ruminococcaceae bacterium]|nr:PolC-type DNA polymerase III [Oscillospiraceae bacterium]